MAKELPPTHEKDYLELLYDYHSDETKKTRRNLIVVSFLIVALHLVGLTLKDIRPLWANLDKADTTVLMVLALVLLAYWLVLFVLYSVQDYQLHKERRVLLHKHVTALEAAINKYQRKMNDATQADKAPSGRLTELLNETQAAYTIYTAQVERTRWASRLRFVTKVVEYGLPCVLALIASGYLVCDLLNQGGQSP